MPIGGPNRECTQMNVSVNEIVAHSHFEMVGGEPAVDRIVESFYEHMATLPQAAGILALHPRDLSATKALLKKYLTEWLGGPKLYSHERGHPRLRLRHAPFRIGVSERDAWMACMGAALDEVVASTRLRDLLLKQLFQVADWMRNSDVGL